MVYGLKERQRMHSKEARANKHRNIKESKPSRETTKEWRCLGETTTVSLDPPCH